MRRLVAVCPALTPSLKTILTPSEHDAVVLRLIVVPPREVVIRERRVGTQKLEDVFDLRPFRPPHATDEAARQWHGLHQLVDGLVGHSFALRVAIGLVLEHVELQTLKPRLRPVRSAPSADAPQHAYFGDAALVIDVLDLA